MQIAVLGGGLTGLSAAFHLSYRFPKAQILLFEKSTRLGGWVQSEYVDVQGRRILLERGPRTLRPQGAAVLELIRSLGIEDELITVPTSSAASKRRYVYVPPDQLPGFSGLLNVGIPPSFPLVKLLFSQTLSSFFRLGFKKFRTGGLDESGHSFHSRILSEDLATTLSSAFYHGVYAADSRQISAHATMSRLASKDRKKAVTNLESNIASDLMQPYPNVGLLGDALKKNSSVYSFKRGLETLPRAIEEHLERQPNVQIFRGSPILNLCTQKDHTFELSYLSSQTNHTSSISTINPTHIVSALPLPSLHTIIQPQSQPSSSQNATTTSKIPHLTANTSSTVHVLNLVFPTPPHEIHPPGFGYLIPRPKHDYPIQPGDENPGILGVVFDSCSTWQQDEPGKDVDAEEWYTKGSHTKITVMLGGPYPLYIPPSLLSSPSSSNAADVPYHIQIILDHISTHLNRSNPLPSPVYYRLWRNENCIPTYSVRHLDRIKEIREMLNKDVSEGGWGGRMEVIGAGVEGVSVPDCVLAGRNVGLKWL